jgi:hypothetical protein
MHYYGATHSPQNSTLAKSAIHLEKFSYGQVVLLASLFMGISACDCQLAQLRSKCQDYRQLFSFPLRHALNLNGSSLTDEIMLLVEVATASAIDDIPKRIKGSIAYH